MDPDSLAREVAKWLAKSLVAMKTTEVARDALTNYTNFDPDGKTVKLGSGAVGMVVSAKLSPVTDKMVDKTADFVTEKWKNRRSKKDTEKK